MTEAEWLTCNTTEELLYFVQDEDSYTARKYRLLFVACCQRVVSFMRDKRSRRAVEMVEKFADEAVSEAAYNVAMQEARNAIRRRRIPKTAAYNAALAAASDVDSLHEAVCSAAYAMELASKSPQGFMREQTMQCSLIRDIFGNPFRHLALNPAWLTSTVVSLAQGIYSEKAFDRMPILGDALQDAGCDNEDILNHCRGESVHVRGCFVVDLLLGKE
jgi:hypothetical protein